MPPKSAPPPEFFVDRSLGRRMVPDALASLGVVVHTTADVYPGGEDERVRDARWIRDADSAGWVALAKDERIIRDGESHEVLLRSRLEFEIRKLIRQHR